MRILLINFEMDPNSRVLAWQYYVALELAKLSEHIVVLTDRYVPVYYPRNMAVMRLPHYAVRTATRDIGGRWLANAAIYRICRKHALDACFIHMNVEWVNLLAPAFRLLRLPVIMWYAHGTVTEKLRQAHRRVGRVVTSTPEGFRIPSDKVSVIGQGVDASLFQLQEREVNSADIISVGRISIRKRIRLMVEAMNVLIELDPSVPFRLILIGPPLTKEDANYLASVNQLIASSSAADRILLLGHVPIYRLPMYYRSAFLHLNVSQTGSMDKTVMEALAAGCPVLTSNEAFHNLLSEYPDFIIRDARPEPIAHQILSLYQQRNLIERGRLRQLVVGKHDLATYGQRILNEFERLKSDAKN